MARTFRKARVETTVDRVSLECDGSITLPQEVMKRADIWEFEQVNVLNKNNGKRFVTYVIPGKDVCIQGAAARLAMPGDTIIILTYEVR